VTTADAAGSSSIRLPPRRRPKQAPHFAVAWKIGTIVRPEREVFAFAWFKSRGGGWPARGIGLVRRRIGDAGRARYGEPVVGVRPRPGLFWIFARRFDLRG